MTRAAARLCASLRRGAAIDLGIQQKKSGRYGNEEKGGSNDDEARLRDEHPASEICRTIVVLEFRKRQASVTA